MKMERSTYNTRIKNATQKRKEGRKHQELSNQSLFTPLFGKGPTPRLLYYESPLLRCKGVKDFSSSFFLSLSFSLSPLCLISPLPKTAINTGINWIWQSLTLYIDFFYWTIYFYRPSNFLDFVIIIRRSGDREWKWEKFCKIGTTFRMTTENNGTSGDFNYFQLDSLL